MIDFHFTVDTTEGERQLSLLADSLDISAIDKALRLYGERWLRQRVQERFDTRPGWPPRKEATQAALARSGGGPRGAAQSRGDSKMRRKLARDLKRAKARLGRVEDMGGFEQERARQSFLAAQGKRSQSMSAVIRSRLAAVERRETTLREFERLAAGGTADAEHSLFGPDKRGAKQMAKLQGRMGRNDQTWRAPLGRIAQSMVLKVKDGRLTYGSEIAWAGAHNEGATVGHGAKLPARPFAFLEPVDLEVLVAMLMNVEGVGVTMT